MITVLSAYAALIPIDVQQGLLDPSWGTRNNPTAEENIARLVDAWRRTGRPIHHVHHASSSAAGTFYRSTPGYEPKLEALPAPGEPIHVKQVNSGFIGTNLEQSLRDEGVGTVVFVGFTTPRCVSTTARMASNLGFTTYVVEDATAAFERAGLDGRMRSASNVHLSALSDLPGEFATVARTKRFLEALMPGPLKPRSHASVHDRS